MRPREHVPLWPSFGRLTAVAVAAVAVVALTLGAVATGEASSPVPSPLTLNGPITDETGVLAGGSAQIQVALQRLFDATGVALSVAFVSSTDGEPIAQFAADTAQHNDVGSRGALLMVAVADHAEVLQIGTGLRDTITQDEVDGVVAQFDDHLRQSDYVGGVVAVADALGAAVVPTPTPKAIAHPTDGPPNDNSTTGKHGGSGTSAGGIREVAIVLAAVVVGVAALWFVLRWRAGRRRRMRSGPSGSSPPDDDGVPSGET